MPKIAILYETNAATPMVLEERHIDQIRAHNPGGQVLVCQTEQQLLDSGFDAEILFSWGRLTPQAYCARCTGLKWIQSLSAGAEGLLAMECAKEPLIISKMNGVHGVPMSESCIAYILSFLRGLPRLRDQQKAHVWKKPADPGPDECRQKTVAIIGVGDIGHEVARKCSFFGMKVVGCRRTPRPMEFVDEMYPVTELHQVLAMADFVVCLVPASPQSRHMFSAGEFAAMKPTGVFINIGRGSVVDTQALIDALRRGVIGGAALDALEEEPLSPDSPLWDMENVIVSPHCSADSPFYFDRAIPVVCENLDRYRKGEPILHRVL
jgi:phosphoglycerate dehydrogenase-like enzyme